jgi:hypothetical protein
VMSLALSQAVPQVNLGDLTFPAQFLIDYVRVYQIDGQNTKITCDPTGLCFLSFVFRVLMMVLDYPTADYIKNHKDAYEDASQTLWTNLYTPPTSSYRGEC